jgi:CheY-like chemotaxis protein
MKDKQLKVLVVDDSKNHRDSATVLLKEHNLTIVSSYDEAEKLLRPNFDYTKLQELRKEKPAGGFFYETPEELKKMEREHDLKLQEEATTYPDFDVVLLDLLMPASPSAQGPEGMKHVGKEMPIGTFLVLLAMSAGVKNIGLVTDTNHHNHPASACLDPINRKVIKIGDVRVLATNYPDCVTFDSKTGEHLSYEYLQSEEGKAKYPGDWNHREGTFEGKGWDSILQRLLNEENDTF